MDIKTMLRYALSKAKTFGEFSEIMQAELETDKQKEIEHVWHRTQSIEME